MAESLPTSLSTFAHRRPRVDSVASFAYYQDDDEESEPSIQMEDSDIQSVLSNLDDLQFGEDDEDSAELEHRRASGDFVLHRRSSTQSRGSVHARLLKSDSAATGGSAAGTGRVSQKVYMVNEDLTIAIAGFCTSQLGFSIYVLLCLSTLGLGWLLFRWLPRWHIRLVGQPCALSDCHWVVIEVGKDCLLPLLVPARANSVRINGASSPSMMLKDSYMVGRYPLFLALTRRPTRPVWMMTWIPSFSNCEY
jgi:cation-transporting P-type ATPase 13A2